MLSFLSILNWTIQAGIKLKVPFRDFILFYHSILRNKKIKYKNRQLRHQTMKTFRNQNKRHCTSRYKSI